MKLDSKECNEALKNYRTKNNMEEIAVKVLMAKDEDVINVPGLMEFTHEQFDELELIIKRIRNDIGIEED